MERLETGCELDFHFVDDATAEIGINDYVYTLKDNSFDVDVQCCSEVADGAA